MSVTRTSPAFASARAHPSPAKPPPTITTCAFVVPESISPPASGLDRVSGARLQQLCDEAGPSRLVRRADAAAGVAVEVLVEVDVVAELAVVLHLGIQRVDLAYAGRVLQKDSRETIRQLLRDLIERDTTSRAGRTLDEETVPVIVVELLKRLDEQKVDGKPHRAAPVRVASEESRSRLARLVVDAKIAAIQPEDVWMRLVIPRHRSHTVVRQKLFRIEHPLEHRLHSVDSQERQQPAFASTRLVPM